MKKTYKHLLLLPTLLIFSTGCNPDGIQFGSPNGNSGQLSYSAGEVSTMREKKEVDKKLEEVDGVVSVGVAGTHADSAWLEVKVSSEEAQQSIESRAEEVFEEMPVRVVLADSIGIQEVAQEAPMKKTYSVSEIKSMRQEEGLDDKLMAMKGVLSIGITGESEDDAYLEIQVADAEAKSVVEAMETDLPMRITIGERAVAQQQMTYSVEEVKSLREAHNLDQRLMEVAGVASIGIGGNSAEDAWIQVNCEHQDDIVGIQEALGEDLHTMPIKFAVSGKVVAQ